MKSLVLSISLVLSAAPLTLMANPAPPVVSTSEEMAMQTAADFLKHYQMVIDQTAAAWPGFDPDVIPKMILERDGSNVIHYAIVIDHPNAAALGDATPIAWDGQPNGRAMLVRDLKPDLGLSDVQHFEFDLDLADAPTFVIASNCIDQEWPGECMSEGSYAPFVMHEMFHRFQFDSFAVRDDVDQMTYDFSAENLKLAWLENTLLQKISGDTTADEAQQTAKALVAVRAARHVQSPMVALDEQQERFEGSARYIEHQISDLVGGGYGRDDYTIDLKMSLSRDDVQPEFGFGRFYATGATQILLLEKMGVTDAKEQITAGASPMQVMAKALNLSKDDHTAIMADLMATYDADGSLTAKGEELAALAKDGAGIWDE